MSVVLVGLASPAPPVVVIEAIRDAIRSGRVVPGIQLPSSRGGKLQLEVHNAAIDDCYVCDSGSASCRGWYNRARTSGRGPTDRSIWLAGRTRTRFGHQNHRPMILMIDGVISVRTTKVSNIRPMPIVDPN